MTSKYVSIRMKVPKRHYEIVEKVATVLDCSPETVFQRALNHALLTNTLGHVVESMLGEKYRTIFNNHHDLNLGSSGKTTTIRVPIETVEKLNCVAMQLEEITSKKYVTPAQVIELCMRQVPSTKS
jgi:hypothetical protein